MALTHSPVAAADTRFSIDRVPAGRTPTTLIEDVRHGFEQQPRQLPPKYFYDERGSELFDRICDTPEYYPTRTEADLIEAYASAIAGTVRPDHVIELGAGTSRKTDALLAACAGHGLEPCYWPYDVCEEVLHQTGERLLAKFPWLRVHALIGDYTAGLDHLPRPAGRCLYVFLGGTLGNFEPEPARVLLSGIRHHMEAGDALLLGTDRVKDRATLEAAYNDASGISAEFNRNVLHVINRELDADFDPEAFTHEAVFNEAASRMEMYLRARAPQSARVRALDRLYRFAEGERLFTEISRKFTTESLRSELAEGGLVLEDEWLDPKRYFSLSLSRIDGRPPRQPDRA